LEKALAHLNPYQPHYCEQCERVVWRRKTWLRAAGAAALALLLAALLLNTVAQAILWLSGFTYPAPPDEQQLRVGVDLRCPACGAEDICRSVLQPPDRVLAAVNPFEPYRCVSCWRRLWRLKSPPRAMLSLALLGVVLPAVIRIPVAYHQRRVLLLRIGAGLVRERGGGGST
jgi:hypothetical protein